MRKTTHILQRAARLSYRVRNRLRREIAHRLEKLVVLCAPTHRSSPEGAQTAWHLRLGFLDAGFLTQLQAQHPGLPGLVLQQSGSALRHEFNLLGSGATVVAHGIRCLGVEGVSYPPAQTVQTDRAGHWLRGRINRTNLPTSQRIWQAIEPGYVPIDWQLDFKSGHRWRENVWHRDIRFAHLPGVDVKVPWELARLQHLPHLALACHFAQLGSPGFHDASTYEREFRHQVLDFIATNPPGFGVNWSCAMDVGIRCANLLVARDILSASGAVLDQDFEQRFAASIVAHARHILKNLEWSPVYRGNHYLANIVGLLFAAAYLPCSSETDAWLAFAVQELFAEIEYQFHADGSNFEASVCYHRLSAEMALWGLALLTGLPQHKLAVLTQPATSDAVRIPRLVRQAWPLHPVPGEGGRLSPVPPWVWERLAKMARFTQTMTRPDGQVTQFGDNDSGRFILLGSGEQIRAHNDPASPAWSLDHAGLVAGIHALLGESPDPSLALDPGAEMIRAFASVAPAPGKGAPAPLPIAAPLGGDAVWHDMQRRFHDSAPGHRWQQRFDAAGSGLLDGLSCQAFPGMGCYVFRSPRLYLAIRCGELGIQGLGAHAHCDQLGIELVIDGVDRVRDPGTRLYTASMPTRNAYRSALAHHVPRVPGREPANLQLGPFDLRGGAVGECTYLGPRGFAGRHAGYGPWVHRIVVLEPDGISVLDFAEGGLALADPTPASLPFSSGYGYPAFQTTP